jgi:hypothetical protein
MSDRSERREEIKLVIEYVKLALSVAGVFAIVLAVLQWRTANLAAKEAIYERMTTEWRDHLKSFVENHELRPYFEESKQLGPNDQNAQAVLALADVRLDTADAILTYAALHAFSGEIGGWRRTFAHAFQTSPTLCARLKQTRSNYGLLLPVADEACPSK